MTQKGRYRHGCPPRYILTLIFSFLVAFAAHALPVYEHALPFVLSADSVQQGFVRIINQPGRGGTVRIHAIDDTGERFGPVELDIGANETRHLNSTNLEQGAPSKGLSGGVGDGEGHWRLELSTTLDIKALAYIRTADGFVTTMHDVVHVDEGSYHVPFFNPASNRNQRSMLRLVNPSYKSVDVTITGQDDNGEPSADDVSLAIPASAARMLSAQELEEGADDFEGRLGDGAGKWQLTVLGDDLLWVMSLLQSPTGHLTNLSTTSPTLAVPPPPEPEPPVIEEIGGVSRTGIASFSIVSIGGRFPGNFSGTRPTYSFRDWGFQVKQDADVLVKTSIRESTGFFYEQTIAPSVEGTPSGSRPTRGSSVWSGKVRAFEAHPRTYGKPVTGDARLELDVDTATIRVSLTNLTEGNPSMSWNVRIADGAFQSRDGYESMQGAYYGERHQGLAGQFQRGRLDGVFSVIREPAGNSN